MKLITLIKEGEHDIRMTGDMKLHWWETKTITHEGEVYKKEEYKEDVIDLDESFKKYISGEEKYKNKWRYFEVDIFEKLGIPEFKIYHYNTVRTERFGNSENGFIDFVIECDNLGLLDFIPKDKYGHSCLRKGKYDDYSEDSANVVLYGYGFNNAIYLHMEIYKWLQYDISKLTPHTRLKVTFPALKKYYGMYGSGFSGHPTEDMSEADKCKVLLEYAEIITHKKQKQLNYR
jgi:hypothetical protein